LAYYYLGTQRVGMRVYSGMPGTVYWLHGDHLGSASLTTSITGTRVSELRYYPFGEVRWQWGNTPTDRTFTGQRVDSYSNIIEMGARWYSPLLGRFLSADSIVPRPGDPQAFNKYSYSSNSPLDRIDPSGHGDCNVHTTACKPWWIADREVRRTTYSSAQKRASILEIGRGLQETKGQSSLEKFARLTDYAASLYDEGDTDSFMLDTSFVILGWSRSVGMYWKVDNLNSDWLGQNAYPEWTGWAAKYSDKDTASGGVNNQMFHVWFYAAVSYFDGPQTAGVGNWVHETPIYDTGDWGFVGQTLQRIYPDVVNNGDGVSRADFLLGERGIELGYGLNYAAHLNIAPQLYRPLLPSEVGDWLRINLGEAVR
jgi:RHS repeat-associated protein